MADNWEDEADGLTSGVPLPVAPKTDRWEGEDEEEVPDAWDAEPAAPAAAASAPATAAADKKSAATTKPKKGKKALAEALEKKRAEAEERKKQTATGETSDSAGAAPGLSAEELRKIQEESDLLLAKETFGVNDTAVTSGLDPEKSIDKQQPSSKEDFDRLSRLLSQKLRGFEASPHYAGFIEGVYRECALELDQECLRRLSTMFTALAAEKQKMQKSAKGKPKKTKGTVKVERDPAGAVGAEDYDQYDDFDDFM